MLFVLNKVILDIIINNKIIFCKNQNDCTRFRNIFFLYKVNAVCVEKVFLCDRMVTGAIESNRRASKRARGNKNIAVCVIGYNEPGIKMNAAWKN